QVKQMIWATVFYYLGIEHNFICRTIGCPTVNTSLLCLFNNGVFTVSNNTAIVGITATTIEF
ncbi:MAG: hypothetical protein VX212_15425, partial [Pseudomonadota bacterium]|nr:hypothetical protein [Pseudomonadota bacterium]